MARTYESDSLHVMLSALDMQFQEVWSQFTILKDREFEMSRKL